MTLLSGEYTMNKQKNYGSLTENLKMALKYVRLRQKNLNLIVM